VGHNATETGSRRWRAEATMTMIARAGSGMTRVTAVATVFANEPGNAVFPEGEVPPPAIASNTNVMSFA
jgi:hypothetical protein